MATFDTKNHNEIGFSPPKKADELYKCRYCEAFFVPTKRFVQKYCRESCRVLDYKRRKTGIDNIQGTNTDKGENFTKKKGNNTKQKDIKEKVLQDILPELESIISKRDKVFEKKLNNIINKINWAIGISGFEAATTDSVKQNIFNNIQNKLHILQNLSQVSNNSNLGQKPENVLPPLGSFNKPNEKKAGNDTESNDKKWPKLG